jgi:hypothetical protein
MNQHRLLFELDRVAVRFRLLRFWQLLAVAWLVAAAVALGVLGLKFGLQAPFSSAVPVLCIAAVALAGAGAWFASLMARDSRWVARQVEQAFPELHSCLLAAVEQQPELPDGRFGYLQTNVIQQALLHAQRHEWSDVVPIRRVAAAAAGNLAALTMFLVLLAGVAFMRVSPSSAAAVSGGLIPVPSGPGFSVTVEPGDTEVERGTSLLVLARVAGQMPPEAMLVMQPASGEEGRLAMSASLEDPVFGGRIPVVDQPLEYHIELGDHTTATYKVTVFEYPRLEKADAQLVYPAYTGQEPRLVQDVRTVSVVEGTELTLTCYLNKPVETAVLTEDKQSPFVLAPISGEKPAYQVMILCDQTRRLKLELIDEAGRKNVKTAQFTINVLPNQPVTLKPVFPARDLEVSALEEIDVKATAWDEFGVKRFGLSYALSGKEPVDVVLGENAAARQKHDLAHTIRLEDLRAEPDDLLSYHFWAEDYAADGSLRRTESDMYFAEVRPFEEIFRQGQQPPGGQQQQQQQSPNAMQAQQIAQLQKEIINATWKVIRREIGSKLTAPFASDAEQIQLSQGSALEQATALAEKLQDPESQEHGEAVVLAMQQAIKQLTAAHDQPSAGPLLPALKAEQAAYQALLKLRAREHNIVRQSQRQQRGQSSARSQQQRQQMQQLDLKEDENRYETQRQAQDQQESPEQREDRQVLNRLKELAQRQHDLNDRLKELQSALEEARTEQQREELKRQLQRLQEEQRQVLQDTEELQSRMETPENMERMSAEREQLQQAREQAQRAAEALDETRISQAAASGTRAEQNFEELRNEFRRRASGRFSEEMQQMRQAARELDQREQDLSRQLNEQAAPAEKSAKKSLQGGSEREKLAEELTQQRRRLAGIQEQMRQTIDDAEETEPLLAEKLYEAARNANDQNVERALEATERSLRSGLARDAQQQEEQAGHGITQLREGIEKAAEAVLGDETEALRRAREELQRLANELNDEIRQNDPTRQAESGQEPGAKSQEPGASGQEPGASGQQSDQRPGQKTEEQNRQQAGQQSENQKSDGQKGEKGQQKGKGQGGQSKDGQPQSGQEPSQQPGQEQSTEEQGGKAQGGQKNGGQKNGGQKNGGQKNGGQKNGGQAQGGQAQDSQQAGQRGGQRQSGQRLPGGNLRGGTGPFEDYVPRDSGPLTGERFRDWSDRLRDVEEMVADPELRAEAARIRERARSMRAELKRHAGDPNWELVQVQVAGPLVELRDRVAAELLRRTAKQAIVPLDRDPVPPKYSEKTRLYYEQLGSGKN